MGDSAFARQLAFDGGRVEVDAMWNCPIVPHGGLVTAIAAKAMADELADPDQRLRSITSVFAGAVQPGPVDVEVTVVRRGRSISQLSATLRNPGSDAGLTALAVFGAHRPGFEFTDLVAPDAPPPDECMRFRDAPDGPYHFNFWDHVDGRLAVGHARNTDFPPSDSSERVYWYRFDEPPFLDDGNLDPLALVTLADTMPGAVAQRVGSDTPVWLPPSADLTVHVFADTTSDWVLTRNHCRWAGDGYASLDMELWSPDGRLLAYGTQVAFFVFPDGPPSV
ncbi:MAG TPA: thioesterase family protein [Acidimicrobiales bacterium]|nr:thioesterase family protein [Acidimicrobiales bacterium]